MGVGWYRWQYEYGNVTKRFLLFIMNKKITKKIYENCCYGWNKHLSNPFNLNSLSQKKILFVITVRGTNIPKKDSSLLL